MTGAGCFGFLSLRPLVRPPTDLGVEGATGGTAEGAALQTFVTACVAMERLLGQLGLHLEGGNAGATGTFGPAFISCATGVCAAGGAEVEVSWAGGTFAAVVLDERLARRTTRWVFAFEADGAREAVGGGGTGEVVAEAEWGTVTAAIGTSDAAAMED